MKIVKPNYWGFKHEEVYKNIDGELTFLNDFCLFDNYQPVAVYKNDNPDLEKGHKPYCYLLYQKDPDGHSQLMIGGVTEKEMETERFQAAKYCPDCEEVIYSLYRHDFRLCSCEKCMVDGGKDYFKTSTTGIPGMLDLVTDEFTPREGFTIKEKK